MEITNVSSEELSPYSFIHDSPLRSEENKHSKDNFGPRRNSLFISNNQQPRRVQSLKKLRPVSEPSLKNSIKSLNTHESKKLPAKSNRKESEKDNLKISSRKVKPTNKPFKGVGSLSTNPAVLGNPSSSKKKEPRQFSSKNKANNLGNVPALDRNETIRSGSKRKTNEVIEIEVFMPVIDAVNNTITYPKSTKPIVKRYYLKNNVPKSRGNTHENNHLIKKNKESTKKSYLHAKTKKDAKENSNKIAPNSIRKGNVTNAVKTSFSKRGSIGKEVKNMIAMDSENKKTANSHRSSGKDVNTTGKDLERKKTTDTDRPHTKPRNATYSEKQKVVAEFQCLLKDITFDAENIPTSNAEAQSGYANFCQSRVEEYLREVSSEKLSEGGKNVCIPAQMQVHKARKLQSGIACNFVEDGKLSLRQHARDITDSILALTDDELDNNSRKEHRQHGKKPKSKGPYRDTKRRNARKYKHLYYEKIALERKESNFSSPGSLTDISGNENGWRRTIPKTSFSSECFPQKSKWRRNIKEDELSMDCWIERSKYLQSRQQSFQMKTQPNNWRPS